MAEDLLKKYDGDRDRLGDAMSACDVFSRSFGTEMAAWELRIHQNLLKRIGSSKYRIAGFVHYTRDRDLVSITPSPWIIEGVLVHIPVISDMPAEGAFVEIVGRSVGLPRLSEGDISPIRAFTLEEVQAREIPFINDVRPTLTLKELSDMLFQDVGMAEASKRVFARLFVSSPPFGDSIGGLTTGIQAIASEKQVKRLLSFTRQAVPPALRKIGSDYQQIRGMKISTPRIWRFDVGKIHATRMKSLCVDRRDPDGFQEVSMSALTNDKTAKLPDVPLALTTEDFWVEASRPQELQLPILKSIITFHLMTPTIDVRSVNAVTTYILERLQKIKESFGLGDGSLARGNILDADRQGRPLSAIKLARATARVDWKKKLRASDLKEAWNQILEPALKEFLELTYLKEEAKRDWGEDARLEKLDTRIHKALRKLDSGKTGSLGPTLHEIAEEAGIEQHEVLRALDEMKRLGVVYEPRTGHFRLV